VEVIEVNILVCNHKGGVGKTFVASHLAFLLSERYNVLGIDGDSQRNLSLWLLGSRDKEGFREIEDRYFKREGKLACYHLTSANLNFIEQEVRKYDYCIFDSSPKDTEMTSLLEFVDVVIMPDEYNSKFSFIGISDVLSIMKQQNIDIPTYILFNKVPPMRYGIYKLMSEIRQAKLGLDVIPFYITLTVRVPEAEFNFSPVWSGYYGYRSPIRKTFIGILNFLKIEGDFYENRR